MLSKIIQSRVKTTCLSQNVCENKNEVHDLLVRNKERNKKETQRSCNFSFCGS